MKNCSPTGKLIERALKYWLLKASPPCQWRSKPLERSTSRRRTGRCAGAAGGGMSFRLMAARGRNPEGAPTSCQRVRPAALERALVRRARMDALEEGADLRIR